jgi:hypothetical protein
MKLGYREEEIFSYLDKEQEIFAAYSPAITFDLEGQLFAKMVERISSSVFSFPIQIAEMEYWEGIIGKVSALEEVFGMLNDLTSEQMEIYTTAVKRRPFFK